MKKTSWKLKRNGNIYCASACGGKCKYEEYQKVLKESKNMIKKLGKNWKLDLNHNLGWFNGVKLKIDKDNWISIDKNYNSKEYRAQLNHSFNIHRHKNINKVLQLVIDECINKAAKQNELLKNLQKVLK